MLRAPSIALLALLAGAAFACSDTVPPPGATLSGFVYYDTNANGIRDSCDGDEPMLQSRISLTPGTGETQPLSASTLNGAWTIEDVPPGNYTAALVSKPFDDNFWPVTGPQVGTGAPRYEVSLRGYETVDGLDFGVATVRPVTLPAGRYALVTVLFDDTNSDGVADPGECLIESSPGSGFDSDVASRLENNLPEPPKTVLIPYFQPDSGYWRISGPDCGAALKPKPSSVDRIYLAPVGITKANQTGSITLRTFVDDDLDGVRDETEQPLSGYGEWSLWRPESPCLVGPGIPNPTFEGGPVIDGRNPRTEPVTYEHLPEGAWRLSLSDSYQYDNEPFIAIPTGGYSQTIELSAGQSLEVDLPFRMTRASWVEVRIIEDVNRNGLADAGEPGVDGFLVYCFQGTSDDGSCSAVTVDGVALIGPAINASYRLAVEPDKPAIGDTGPPWRSDQPPQTVSVGEGERVSLTFLVYR